jgi:tripartite-type tricarboxylate transporter receptor subunit TctC
MKVDRRLFLAGTASLLAPSIARSQGYADRPIRIVVPFASGGPADFIVRLLSDPLKSSLRQPKPL